MFKAIALIKCWLKNSINLLFEKLFLKSFNNFNNSFNRRQTLISLRENICFSLLSLELIWIKFLVSSSPSQKFSNELVREFMNLFDWLKSFNSRLEFIMTKKLNTTNLCRKWGVNEIFPLLVLWNISINLKNSHK